MTIQLTPNGWDKVYKAFILLCLIFLALIISDMFKSCRKSGQVIDISPIKETIKDDLKRKDSVKKEIVKKDSIREFHHHHYHTIRHDSLIPCETKLITCDTLLVADSSLIASLKREISLDDTIIWNYQKVVYSDSLTIKSLSKSLKRQRNKTKLALILAGIFGGVAALK